MSYILSIHTGHDANLAISDKAHILKYIEFEKITGERYFRFLQDEGFQEEFDRLILPQIEGFKSDISKVNLCWLSDIQINILKQYFPNCIFEAKKHHISHVHSLYSFTRPQENDLIISFDGGGDEDDYFKVYKYHINQITLIEDIKLNLGNPYRILGLISDEIKSRPIFEYETNIHLPGKIMGLAPLGRVAHEYIPELKRFYVNFTTSKGGIKDRLEKLLRALNIPFTETLKVNREIARNILRTSQKIFEDLFFEKISMHLQSHHRILVVGGCALNVKLNSTLFEKTNIEIFAPPIAGDCGISLCAAMSDFSDLNNTPFQDSYIGLKARGNINYYVKKYSPIKVSTNSIAKILAEGHVVATMIGRIEAGPRALGNRSLLANPLTIGIKDKLNRIKEREFFRPIAPIVTEKSQNLYFENSPMSKYMTFSPRIKKEYKQILSEIVHFDETCRIQTVTKDEVFLYDLLIEFGKITGVEVLANTSFNSKGKAIINDIDEAFELLESTGIDFLLIDDLLFKSNE